jgi:hypothetical protein
MFPDNGRRCKEDRGMARSCCDPAQARDEERDPGMGNGWVFPNPPGSRANRGLKYFVLKKSLNLEKPNYYEKNGGKE